MGAAPAAAPSAQFVSNDAYPNVASDMSHPSLRPHSPSEAQAIQDRMMSLAAQQEAASRTNQSGSVVDQMKAAVAKQRQQQLLDDEAEAAANGN